MDEAVLFARAAATDALNSGRAEVSQGAGLEHSTNSHQLKAVLANLFALLGAHR